MHLRPGYVEFAWGHPDLHLLPLEHLRHAAVRALADHGHDALSYGAAQGPGRLIEQICARLEQVDGQAARLDQILITAGVSHALDLICAIHTCPGNIALVESPVYHFALRILRDRGLELLPIPTDQDGLRLDMLAQTLAQLRRANRLARLLYTVPTFSNPTGITLGAQRRSRLAEIAAEHDLLVVEDDVYRELWFDTPPPPSMIMYDQAHVVRLGSFSKILAPGLRLGWMMAAPALISRAAGSGVLTSGGGLSHFQAHVVAEYMRLGLLDAHVVDLRAAYKARRDTLVAALLKCLPAGCHFTAPEGGFFIWVRLPEGIDAAALLARAEEARVAYVPGAHFHVDGGGQRELRLAFSLLPPQEMVEGARRLGHVIGAAS
jgi:DNA-binding transcriptional MocR family regulator